jgi:VanZ family protein
MPRSRFFLLAFLLAIACTFVMATLPHPPRIPGNPQDKIQHITAFFVLTVLAIPAFPRVRLPYIVLSLSAFGALIEFVQAIPALHRDSDWRDWVADTLAILGAILITRLLRRLQTGPGSTPARG